MKTSIAKALKEKSRIAGRIVKLQSQVKKYNKYVEGQTPIYDSAELLIKLQEEWACLEDIKARIARANCAIAHKLVRLTEAKAELKFWETFPTGPSREIVIKNKYVNSVYVEVEVPNINVFDVKTVQENVDRVQLEIENLQDDIDNFNAVTSI